jgi:photosystem II stability/assembly factor-like uncharacterized protein
MKTLHVIQSHSIFLFFLSLLLIGLFSCSDQKNNWEIHTTGMNDNFHDIEIITSTTAIAYSYGSGKIIKTEDTGKSWDIIYQLDSIYLEQIQFINPNLGFICGNDNTLLKTTNGGRNWESIAIDTLENSASIYGMYFIDENIGFIGVLTNTGKNFSTIIYQTANSGEEWNMIQEIPEMILNLETINNELWGSGHNVIIKNIDRTAWEYSFKDTIRKVGQIRDIHIVESSIIAVSFNGYVITQQNGIWSSQQITKNRLRCIAGNEKLLVTGGDNNAEMGNLFISKDKGLSWIQNELVLEDIHRIKYRDNTFWAIGKKDQLLQLKN